MPVKEAGARRGRSRRASFPGWIPRPLKRQSGRGAREIPANLRTSGVSLSKESRALIRRRLRRRLGKYARSIERVSVRVTDVNGPRGGVDRRCRVKVVLSGLPSVVVEGQSASLETAVQGALSGAERAVRRTLQRRRMKPITQKVRRRAA
jgi:hypothetical protein